MSLHVITGRANAGKTGRVNARLFASLARGESPVLVLPSVADTRRATAEFSAKAPTGVAIVALSRWANALWRLHGDGRRIVGSASRGAFVKRAIADVMPPALEDIADSPGFSAMIARTVTTMAGKLDVHGGTSEATRGVARICERYRELIADGGLVESAEAWRALGNAPPVLDGIIAVNRFDDIEEPAIALLTGLARVNEVVVALTWEEDFAPTKALNRTVDELAAVAESTEHIAEAEAIGEIYDLLGCLYTGSAGIRSTGAVRMGLAAGAEAEATLIARFAGEAIAAGTPPERVVVAFPDLQAMAHRVANAFSAESLAVDIDVARPVATTALGRSLDGLLTLALGAGDRTTALGVLLGPHSDVSGEVAAELDRAWRRTREDDPYRLLGDVIQRPGSLLGRAAGIARSLAKVSVDAETGTKWQRLVHTLISAAAARAAVRGHATMTELAAVLEADAGAARAIVRAVGEMASVLGTPCSAGDVRAALRTIVVGGTAGERPGRVQVTEVSRLRSRRFDTVIIGGLTAGEMAVASSDSLAEELRTLFAPARSGQGEGEEHARLAFYQAISRARNQLVLVRRDSDDRGAPVRPSVLWEEVVDAYRAPGEGSDEWPQTAPRRVRVGAADTATWAPVFTTGRRELRKEAAEGHCRLAAPARGELSDLGVLDELSRATVFSATELEAYLQCPYRWFYERVVRPEEIDVEVDARAVGTIAHGLLRAFYDALPEALGAARVTPENTAMAMQLLTEVIATTDSGIAAEGLAEELDVARAARWVGAVVAADAVVLPSFVPTDHELAFGGPGQVEFTLGGVGFKGRIDRIDRSPDAVFVTDYKSSRIVSGHAKFAAEAKIQAVVYALVAREVSGLPVAGSVYRSLRSHQMRGFWRPDLLGGALAFGHDDDSIGEARFDELIAETAVRIETAVAGIRAGRVPREPADTKACGFCALKSQCEGAAR